MLNKPKFMRPSTNKEECTIDVSAKEIPFSCIVDGNESIKAWQIIIYDINNDDKVYDTGRVDLTTSFYPVDEKNRNVVFTKDLNEYPSIIANSFVNREEAYYWTITFWGHSENSVTSYQEVFYANTIPSLSFLYKYPTSENYETLTADIVLEGKGCTFKGEYTQAEGIQLKRYGWRIVDKRNEQVLVDTITKNQIYGSADNIVCNYDGFLNGSNYSVELYVETQNNTKITSSLNFSVSYITTFLSNDFKVETLKNEPAIMLDWNKALVFRGVLKEANNEENIISVDNTTLRINYPVDSQNSIEIPEDFKVIYDNDTSLNFDIDERSYIALSTQLLSGENATLFSAEGYDDDGYEVKRQLSYRNGVFTYKVVGRSGIDIRATYAVTNRPSEYVWYNILMSPLIETDNGEYTAEIKIYESGVVNCIYPSESLYPMATDAWVKASGKYWEDEYGNRYFYPTFGNWSNLKPASNNTETEV